MPMLLQSIGQASTTLWQCANQQRVVVDGHERGIHPGQAKVTRHAGQQRENRCGDCVSDARNQNHGRHHNGANQHGLPQPV